MGHNTRFSLASNEQVTFLPSVFILIFLMCLFGLCTFPSLGLLWITLFCGASVNQAFVLKRHSLVGRVLDWSSASLIIFFLIPYLFNAVDFHAFLIIILIGGYLSVQQCLATSLHDFEAKVNQWHFFVICLLFVANPVLRRSACLVFGFA